jgi:hypothetical protein
MPLYFVTFLTVLGASLLLYLAAAAYAAVARRSPPTFLSEPVTAWLQAAGVALLWFGVGVAWLLFFNIYPIHVDMSAAGDAAFQAFSRGYTRRLPIVVLPYGAACLAWTLALWGPPTRISRRAAWGIATLCVVSILSTPWAALALGDMQEQGYTQAAFHQLQVSHLVRTVALTIAATWALAQRWRSP